MSMADEPDEELREDEIEAELPDPDIAPEEADDGAPDQEPEGDSWEVEVEGVVDDPAETPTIKHLRAEIRERDRRLAEMAKVAPAVIEVGDEPTLEACGWDDDEFKRQLRDYDKRKEAAEAQTRDAQKQAEAGQQRFNTAFSSYRAKAAEMGVPDYEKIETRVASALPITVQNGLLLYLKDKAPSVVLALDKHPQLLEEVATLAQEDPLAAIIRLNDISKGIKVVQRRKGPEPDRPLRGSAPVARVADDKKQDELLAKAQKSGKMDEYREYMRGKRAK